MQLNLAFLPQNDIFFPKFYSVHDFVCALEVSLEEGPAKETLSDDARAPADCESMDVCPKQSCDEN